MATVDPSEGEDESVERLDGRAREQSKLSTRQAILGRARELAVERGTPEQVAVKLREAVEACGLTTGAAYNIWTSQTHFQRDLALRLAQDYTWALGSSVDTEGLTGGWRERMVQVSNRYFQSLVALDDFFLVLQFWGVREPSAELSEALRAGYHQVHEDLADFLVKGLASVGRQIREDRSLEDLTTSVTAFTEGMALRHRFESEALWAADGEHLYGRTFLMLLLEYSERTTRPEPDPDLDEPEHLLEPPGSSHR